MASKSKTYELALKIAGKVDSSLKKSCLAAAKDVNTLSASVQKVSGKAAKAMATATSAAITAITVDAAKKAIEFESTMADVAKVVDGLRDQNGAFTKSYYEMSDALLNMSKSIPMTADALGQIMASAGQAGIASEDLTKFTETAAKMGVAFDTTAEQAGEWMATWRTALNLSQTQVTALGDQLNYLGNTTSENALKLSEVVTRVGALGQTAGLSAGEVAALAASMPGVTAEISATGIKSMMIAMTAGASATSKQAAVLQQLGFTASDMANRMQTDAKGAIIDLLGAIKQLPAAEQTAALSQYFGKESVSSIAPLLKNLGYLQQQFAKVGDASAYTDISTEADIAVSIGNGKRILKQSGKADSRADAERKIRAAVNKANHGSTKLSASIIGDAQLVSAQCVTVVGIGRLSGKYYIDSITHNISGSGYTMYLEMSLVESMSDEVMKDSIGRLYAVGVITDMSYWIARYTQVKYLDGLIVNMATVIKVNRGGSSISTVSAALDVLTQYGVINSPTYWAAKYTLVPALDRLIINAANALTEG